MDLSEALDAPLTGARARVDRERGLLVGSACPHCSATSWPARAICHRCGAVMRTGVALGREGVLLSCTTVHVARPNIAAPYTLGQITIADAIFFAHVRGLDPGARVPLAVAVVVPAAPDGPLDFWFEPLPGE